MTPRAPGSRRVCSRMAVPALLCIALLTAAAAPLSAQAAESAGDPVIAGAQPYEPAEFPEWARNLRRAEIVAVGSFPLTLIASRVIVTTGRFILKSIESGGINPAYAPPAFAPPGAIPLEREGQLAIIGGATVLSIVVALVDYRLGRRPVEPESD